MILDRGEEVSVNLNRRDAVSTLAVLRGVSLGLPQENGPANSREKRWRAIQMAARGTSQKKKQLKNTARAIGSRVWAVEEDSITITTLYIVDCPTIFRASIHAAMIP